MYLSRVNGEGEITIVRKLWQRAKDLVPVSGFHFGRPLVLFQSDDWGRVGLRDREGLGELRSAGLVLGERPYDFYTLETAEDVAALISTLKRHRDSAGRHPSLEMNFVVGNLDFAAMESGGWQRIHLRALAQGLPRGWVRPGLKEAYLSGIAHGVFCPALHGITHFCRRAVERNLAAQGEHAILLRTLWGGGTPYIQWRMPWIGYEYWDPEQPSDDRFLPRDVQQVLIGQAVGAFGKFFSSLPGSACAPGYRANEDTVRAWAQHGIRVAQNGPGALVPPHFDANEVLQLFRTVEFEPAVNANFSLESCLRNAEVCFEQGLPVVVSLHSINFHSTVYDFRSGTLELLDKFLTVLESKHSDLLYLHDVDLCELIQKGSCRTPQGEVRATVVKKSFTMAQTARRQVV